MERKINIAFNILIWCILGVAVLILSYHALFLKLGLGYAVLYFLMIAVATFVLTRLFITRKWVRQTICKHDNGDQIAFIDYRKFGGRLMIECRQCGKRFHGIK